MLCLDTSPVPTDHLIVARTAPPVPKQVYGTKCELDVWEGKMISKAPCIGFMVLVLALPVVPTIVLTGCSTASRESELERNKSLVREMNDEVWNKGNLDRMDEF